jgi:hypothetical protein
VGAGSADGLLQLVDRHHPQGGMTDLGRIKDSVRKQGCPKRFLHDLQDHALGGVIYVMTGANDPDEIVVCLEANFTQLSQHLTHH